MKKRRWNRWIGAAVLAAWSLSAAGYAKEAAAEENAVSAERSEEEIALSYVKLLAEGEYEKLMTQFEYTEEMEALAQDGTLQSSYESLMKLLKSLKATKTPFVIEQYGYKTVCVPCQFEIQNLNLQISFQDGKIAGVLTAVYQEAQEEEETAEEKGYTEKEIVLAAGDGMELPGTLTLPEGDGPFPAVVLVHGSGPSDRDETVLNNKPFRDIAQGLAQRGIASYRYDKRTYVYQKEAASDITLTVREETVDDAVSAVQMLEKTDQIDADQIFVAGHSLGGYVIPMIDQELEEGEAAGYIFLAAPVSGLADLMKRQYDFLFSLQASPSDAEKQQKELIDQELEKLDRLDEYEEDEMIMGAYTAYWKDLETYQATEEAKKITEPCLIMQGEEDYQVAQEEFDAWKEALDEKENVQFELFPGLTHLFMEGTKENGPADYQKMQRVSEKVIDTMAQFITEAGEEEQHD